MANGQNQQPTTPPPPASLHSTKSEFLKCLSEFFKRDLLSIPIVKKYPHSSLSQRCGLKASTLELDTAAYPSIEYIAGTRLSVYPLNPAGHVAAIMEHLVDDIGQHQVMVNNWSKFVQLTGKECLRLALTYLFDIMTAPTRELIKLLADNCREKEQRKRLVAIGQTNDSWERWICSGHRTLRSLFDELSSCKVNASIVLNELNIQQPRQYSISNIKSAKRFRAEIIVVQHKFSLRQIELNLRQLRDRETYEREMSPAATSPPPLPLPLPQVSPATPTRPPSKSNSRSASTGRGASSPALKSTTSLAKPVARRATPGVSPQSASASRVSPAATPPATSPAAIAAAATAAAAAMTKQSPSRPAQSMALRGVNSSKGSRASNRSVRSMASFANSPITTHQVRRVSSFSGPLMSAYANASSSSATSSIASNISSIGGGRGGISASGMSVLEKSKTGKKSLMSVLESQNRTINSETGSPAAHGASAPAGAASSSAKYEGLCSSYLLSLNSNDHLLCEFVENPRFTLKGNRERPIMMIGQDVGVIAFRPFWQQRHLEHDRAHIFYALFKDLSPKKFGDMQLVSLSGHKGRIEDLFKREISQALSSKILSSYTSINRKLFLNVLAAATNKSQLVLSQLQMIQQQQQQRTNKQAPTTTTTGSSINNTFAAIKSTLVLQQQPPAAAESNLPINSRELIELGDKIYKLLVENNGCLYTCCDPHMTQAIEILAFESIARNNPQLTRERLMKLLPKWKGRGQADAEKSEESPSFYTLENTYERAQIVQEIYDSSI